jgi:hypothetical protein
MATEAARTSSAFFTTAGRSFGSFLSLNPSSEPLNRLKGRRYRLRAGLGSPDVLLLQKPVEKFLDLGIAFHLFLFAGLFRFLLRVHFAPF